MVCGFKFVRSPSTKNGSADRAVLSAAPDERAAAPAPGGALGRGLRPVTLSVPLFAMKVARASAGRPIRALFGIRERDLQ